MDEERSTDQQQPKFPPYEEMYERFVAGGSAPKDAARQAQDLLHLSSPVRERFIYWWHTGELIDDLQVHEFTISSLQEKQKYRLQCAFLDFDYLYKDRDNEGFLRSLREGVHRIVYSKSMQELLARLTVDPRDVMVRTSKKEEGGE